jgi:CHAT domain-containing protein
MRGTTLSNMASVYIDLGDPDRSLQLHEEALAVRRALDLPGDVAASLSNIGFLNQLSGRPETALKYYLDALELMRPLGIMPDIASVLGNVASAHLDLKQYDEAFVFWDEALDITETIRATATGEVRRDYLDKEIATYRVLLFALLEAGRDDRVLETLERMNGRFLAEQISSQTGSPAPQFDLTAWQRSVGPEEAYVLTGNFSTPLTSVTVVVADSLRIHARTDTAFVRQMMHQFGERLDVDASAVYEDQIAAIVNYYRSILGRSDASTRGASARRGEPTAEAHRRTLGRAFYDMLIGPIESELAGRTRLTIVPDGPLALLPFETFVRPDGSYLAEHFEVRYIQSLAVLDLLRRREHDDSRKSILAFGNALYDTSRTTRAVDVQSDEQSRAVRNSVANALSRGGDQSDSYDALGYGIWTDLPGTAEEVAAIQSAFDEAVVLTGSDVSEERVKSLSSSGELSQFRVIHFATHGIVVPDVPELSALVLTQDSTSSEDGYLRMDEILDLTLQADFVNLSACETGLGKLYGGDGVVGLTQAFMVAGANSLSVSLWQVADLSTSLYVEELYRSVAREELDYASATARVKRLFIDGAFGDDYRDPYYWAPFVYYGR